MASPVEEDVTVRFEDQEKINEFGRINNVLLELRADLKQAKLDVEKLNDATAELESTLGGNFMLLVGETFIECDEDAANEYCEKKREALERKITEYTEEESTIVLRQDDLKKELYGRFGDSINLES